MGEQVIGAINMVGLQVAFVVFVVVLLASAIATAVLVYRDARLRGLSVFDATLWAGGLVSLWPVIGPLYLLRVVQTRERTAPFGRYELWLVWLIGTVIISLVAGGILAPPDPFRELAFQAVLLPLSALAMYLLVFSDYGPAVAR